MKDCDNCPGVVSGAVARTMTTFVVAVASMIVMALAGCVSPDGIASKAVLAARRRSAPKAGRGRAGRRRLVARLRRSRPRRPDRARDRRQSEPARRRRARRARPANVASAHAAEGRS